MVETQLPIAKSLETLGSTAGQPRPPGEPVKAKIKTVPRVPIRTLGASHRERIATHLLALDRHDRYLRFGFAANDDQIRRYATTLNFERDEIFGIYNRRLDLIAMAHLAFSTDSQLKPCAEFGVSVSATARGRGYGARLFDRAAMHARNEGVSLMFIHALSENAAMLKIARQAGAVVERDGSESEAHLRLLPATLDTRLTELLEEQMARADYRLKWQFKTLGDLFTSSSSTSSAKDDASSHPESP
jgi:GNAT superfamily N-acetyltransferase